MPERDIVEAKSGGDYALLTAGDQVSRSCGDLDVLGRAALVEASAVPRHAADDAAHIAIAVTNGVEFLVTWNFRHIANAAMRARIEQACRQTGYEPPVICTPNELMEANHGKADD